MFLRMRGSRLDQKKEVRLKHRDFAKTNRPIRWANDYFEVATCMFGHQR
jgi:hypothetical protein